MSMTKKDYELIAATIHDQIKAWDNPVFPQERVLGIEILADALADRLELDNPKFDRQKFLTACGIKTLDVDDIMQEINAIPTT